MITKCMHGTKHIAGKTQNIKQHLHGLRLIIVVGNATAVVQIRIVLVGIIAAGSGRVVILVFPVLIAVLQESLNHTVFVGL